MKKNSLIWRRLDNSAKIFPLSTGKRYSTVFRLSVLLKEDIIPETLQEALIETLEKYQSFKVKIKKGFFWHYLENNTKKVDRNWKQVDTTAVHAVPIVNTYNNAKTGFVFFAIIHALPKSNNWNANIPR